MKKHALITGATGNLGLAATQRFLADGYRVTAIAREGQLEGIPANANLHVAALDLSDESATEQFIKSLGPVDAAILTVGGFAVGGLAETGRSQLEKMLALNFYTAYFTARPVFEVMRQQSGGGRIVLVGAKTARDHGAGKGAFAYTLSKTLIFKLAELLNAEGHGKGVVTHVLVPATLDTPQNRSAMPDADFSKWVSPEAAAGVVAFACSPAGASLRETELRIYGGP